MNSCILMAEIVEPPQLRYTTDNLALTEMLVQFPALRAEDPPVTLKVVGWGNLATEIEQNYQKGDRVIIEGRLSMNSVQMDGYKEKKAELTAGRIHALGADFNISASRSTTATSSYPTNASAKAKVDEPQHSAAVSVASSEPVKPVSQRGATTGETPVTHSLPKTALPTPNTDVDDIPF